MFELAQDLITAYWGFAWGFGFGLLVGGFSIGACAQHYYRRVGGRADG